MDISGINSSTSADLLKELLKKQEAQKTDQTKKKHQPPSIEQIVSQLTAKLGLNDNQMIELKKIIQTNMKSMDEERETNMAQGVDKKTGMENMKAGMDKMNEQIKSILTPDQITTFDKFLEESKARQMGNGNFDKSF